jgi:hypothetical protein
MVAKKFWVECSKPSFNQEKARQLCIVNVFISKFLIALIPCWLKEKRTYSKYFVLLLNYKLKKGLWHKIVQDIIALCITFFTYQWAHSTEEIPVLTHKYPSNVLHYWREWQYLSGANSLPCPRTVKYLLFDSNTWPDNISAFVRDPSFPQQDFRGLTCCFHILYQKCQYLKLLNSKILIQLWPSLTQALLMYHMNCTGRKWAIIYKMNLNQIEAWNSVSIQQ